jgi:hypothetical protein
MSIVGKGAFTMKVVEASKGLRTLCLWKTPKEMSLLNFGMFQNCKKHPKLSEICDIHFLNKRHFSCEKRCGVVNVKSSEVSECRKDLMAICFTNPVCQEETANACLRDISLCKTFGYNLMLTMEMKHEPVNPAHKIPLRNEIKKRIIDAKKYENDNVQPELIWHTEESVDTSCFFLTNCGSLSTSEIEKYIREKLLPRITDGISTDCPEFGSEWSFELNASRIV